MRNFKILILIAVILTLIMVLIVRERQHTETIFTYLEREVQQEEARLKVSQELIKNYNELQINYDRLLVNYNELIEDNRWELYTVTGYSANDHAQGTNNIVVTTFDLNYTRVQNLPIVASNCIPLYSIIEIKGLGGFIVLDTGLGYKTENGWEDDKWIDILFKTKEEAIRFGKQEMLVRIIE